MAVCISIFNLTKILFFFSTIRATRPANRDLYFAYSDWNGGLTVSVRLLPKLNTWSFTSFTHVYYVVVRHRY